MTLIESRLPLPALALESGIIGTSLALRGSEGHLFEALLPVKNSHNEELAVLVQRLLLDAELTPKQLQSLLIGSGPGSFTGLRIGFSFMQGLSSALRIPLVRLSSLRACAFRLIQEARLIVVMIDARRSECFAAIYGRAAPGGLRPHFEDLILKEEDVYSRALSLSDSTDSSPGDLCVVSDFKPSELWRSCRIEEPRGLAAALIGLAEGGGEVKGFAVEDLAALRPNYVRAVAAKTIQERLSRSG